MSDDGVLDILQITVQLETAASEAWKPMIRDTILACNDMIASSMCNSHSSQFLLSFTQTNNTKYKQLDILYIDIILNFRNIGQNSQNPDGPKLQRSAVGDAQVFEENIFHGKFEIEKIPVVFIANSQACPDAEVINRGELIFLLPQSMSGAYEEAHFFALMQHNIFIRVAANRFGPFITPCIIRFLLRKTRNKTIHKYRERGSPHKCEGAAPDS
jgi:hypothetical protein